MPGDAASIEIARINAQAQLGSAGEYADASRFGAKTGANASMYNTDTDAATAAAKMASEEGMARAKEAGEMARSRMTNATTLSGQLMAGDPQSSYDITKGLLKNLNSSPSSITGAPPSYGPTSLTPGMKEGEIKLYSSGTPRVPGHGDGTVDTVDAKLAPGEAVLNKAAAEMLGRGLIDLLNKHGMLQMGMPEPDADDMEEPEGYAAGCSKVGYASGTSNVGGSTGDGARGSYLNRSGSSGRADTEAPMGFFPTGERGDGGTGPAPTTPSHYGLTDRGENGSTGNGSSGYGAARGATPRPERYKF